MNFQAKLRNWEKFKNTWIIIHSIKFRDKKLKLFMDLVIMRQRPSSSLIKINSRPSIRGHSNHSKNSHRSTTCNKHWYLAIWHMVTSNIMVWYIAFLIWPHWQYCNSNKPFEMMGKYYYLISTYSKTHLTHFLLIVISVSHLKHSLSLKPYIKRIL